MLKEQRFGVEVEMTGISRKKAADVLAEVFGAIAGEPDGTCYHTRIIKDQKDRKWKVMRDSSITPVRNDNSNAPMDEYRVEMVTPPLNYEDIELLQVVIRSRWREDIRLSTLMHGVPLLQVRVPLPRDIQTLSLYQEPQKQCRLKTCLSDTLARLDRYPRVIPQIMCNLDLPVVRFKQ